MPVGLEPLYPTVRWTVGGAGWTAPNLTICQRQIATSPFRAGSARSQFRTKLVCNRSFPAPPGIGGESPLTISHGIVLWWDTKFFQTFNRQRGNEAPREEQTKTGAGTKTQHPSQSEGSISRWFLPGDSKGGDNSSGSELSPPLAGFFAYFLAGARKYGPAGKHLQKADLDNRPKSCNRVTITTSKYQPKSKPSA